MINKRISIILIMVIIAVGILVSVILTNQKQPMRRNQNGSGIPPVNVLIVNNADIKTQFEIGGHLHAYDNVDLYAEVSGILLETPVRFIEGARFKKGDVLIKIDDSVYKNQVLAQKSSLLNQLTLLLPDLSIDFPGSAKSWETYLHNFHLDKDIATLPEPVSDQERYYIASRNIYNQFYSIKSQEATLKKYNLYAPYDGMVTESNINPGTLVRTGQKLGVFTNTSLYELEAYANVYEIQHLKIGDKVDLTCDDVEGVFNGTIQRINEVIDPATQTLKVYIVSSDRRLREGMYCTARVTTQNIPESYRVARNLLIGKDELYAINPDSTLKLVKVHPVTGDDKFMIVQGLDQGISLLGQPLLNAYEGLKLDKLILKESEM